VRSGRAGGEVGILQKFCEGEFHKKFSRGVFGRCARHWSLAGPLLRQDYILVAGSDIFRATASRPILDVQHPKAAPFVFGFDKIQVEPN
jgi:hypothetical protein